MGILNNGIAVDAEELKFQDGSIGIRVYWKDIRDKESKTQRIDVNISRSGHPEKKEQKKPFIMAYPVQWMRTTVFGIDGLYGVDFSDHKTLNAFFREFLRTESTVENCRADQFIRGMESSLKQWKRDEYISLFSVLYHIGVNQKFTSEGLNYSLAFAWDKEHPFNYQLMVTMPEEGYNVEYYAVFSNAPVHRNQARIN